MQSLTMVAKESMWKWDYKDPELRLIDMDSDINIIRGGFFYHITEKAGLETSHLQIPDHKAFT